MTKTRTGYKLTTPERQTYGGMQWGPGVRHEATGTQRALCSDGWIHFYDDPVLAAFFDPCQGNLGPNALLWKGTYSGKTVTDGTKRGAKVFTTNEIIPLPQITREQRVEIAIRCALLVYPEPSWVAWAQGWLDGSDRTARAAEARAAWATGTWARAWAAGTWAWAARAGAMEMVRAWAAAAAAEAAAAAAEAVEWVAGARAAKAVEWVAGARAAKAVEWVLGEGGKGRREQMLQIIYSVMGNRLDETGHV